MGTLARACEPSLWEAEVEGFEFKGRQSYTEYVSNKQNYTTTHMNPDTTKLTVLASTLKAPLGRHMPIPRMLQGFSFHNN